MITFLVKDPGGLFCIHAEALADGGKNKVYYWTQYNYKYRDFAIGKDFGHLEKILYFDEYISKADCIVDFDVRGNDQIGEIRDRQPERSTFGSGWGCKLEDDRLMLKEFVKSWGLPMQPYKKITGMTALREYLKANPKKYVKLNIFREDMESFYAPDYDTVELKLDEISGNLGAHKETYDFVLEDPIETDVEIGFDGFFNGVDYSRPFLYGYELHKNLYIGKVSSVMPAPLEETMQAFKPLLQKLDYRGAISTEEKIVSMEKHYLLDFCARLASPFTAGYTEWIRNWPMFVYGVGLKQNVAPDFGTKYVGAFALKSSEALDMGVKINIKDPKKVKMIMPYGNKKGNYAISGEDHVAVVIASGDSVQEVLEQIHENAELVDGHGLDKDPLKGIDEIEGVIEEGEEAGIEF